MSNSLLNAFSEPSFNDAKKNRSKMVCPDQVGLKNNGLFGLGSTVKDATYLIMSVPWDVSTSYLDGTSDSRKTILDASTQIAEDGKADVARMKKLFIQLKNEKPTEAE